MRIAVVGGTGLAGRHIVEALLRATHDVVVLARSRGVDLMTGAGLDGALLGADAVVDASNAPPGDAAATRAFFERATKNLFAAERRTRVKHHVLLSIVGTDRLKNANAHFAGKHRQEQLLAESPIPTTLQRATQFFEFGEMVIHWMRQGDELPLPPLLLQPLAAADLGEVLAAVATGVPQGRAADVAGPERIELIDMTRRILQSHGQALRLVPSWNTPLATAEAPADAYLPDDGARLASTTFAAWLARQRSEG